MITPVLCQGARHLSVRSCLARHLVITHHLQPSHHHQHQHQHPALTVAIQPGLLAYLPVCNFSSNVKQLPPIVTYEEVAKALADSSAVVIDVRQAEELERDGAIPGALHIPLADLEVAFMNLRFILMHSNITFQTALSFRPKKFERIFKVSLDESTPLVFSCLAGIRSRKAQRIASVLGFTNTSNFEGGWMEWAEKTR